jgi:hypothetical protein
VATPIATSSTETIESKIYISHKNSQEETLVPASEPASPYLSGPQLLHARPRLVAIAGRCRGSCYSCIVLV